MSCGWGLEQGPVGVWEVCPHCSSLGLEGPQLLRFSMDYNGLVAGVGLREDHCLALLELTAPERVVRNVLKQVVDRRLFSRCLTCHRDVRHPGWYCCTACPGASKWNEERKRPEHITSHSHACWALLYSASTPANDQLRWCLRGCPRLPSSLLKQGQATMWWESGRLGNIIDLNWDLRLLGHTTSMGESKQAFQRRSRVFISGLAPNGMKYDVVYTTSSSSDTAGMILRARSGWMRCDGFDFFLAMIFERMRAMVTVCADVD